MPTPHDVVWTKEKVSAMWSVLVKDRTDADFQSLDFFRVVWSLSRGRVPPGGRCLDLCCGRGALLEVLGEGNYARAGVDITDAAFPALKARMPDCDLRVGDVDAIPFEDESFDAVFACEVLEHLDDEKIQRGLREIRRVLKPGGAFVATTPNNERLLPVVCPDCLASFHPMGHVQTIDAARAVRMLALAGFRDSTTEVFPSLFVYERDSRLKAFVKRMARATFWPILKRFRGNSLFFSGIK